MAPIQQRVDPLDRVAGEIVPAPSGGPGEAAAVVDLVVAAATATPARLLGLTDVGALEPGRRADLVHLDEGLEVVAVMRCGLWL